MELALYLLVGVISIVAANPTTGNAHVQRFINEQANDPNSPFYRPVNNEHFGLDANGNPLDGSEIPEDSREFVTVGNGRNNGNPCPNQNNGQNNVGTGNGMNNCGSDNGNDNVGNNNGNNNGNPVTVLFRTTTQRGHIDGGNDGVRVRETIPTRRPVTTRPTRPTTQPTTRPTSRPTTRPTTTRTTATTIRDHKMANPDIGDDCGGRGNGVGNVGSGNGANSNGCGNGNNNVGNNNGQNNGNNNVVPTTPTTTRRPSAGPRAHHHDEKDFVGFCSRGGRSTFYTIIPNSSCNLFDVRGHEVRPGDVLFASECEDPNHVFDLHECKCNFRSRVDLVTCKS